MQLEATLSQRCASTIKIPIPMFVGFRLNSITAQQMREKILAEEENDKR